MAESIKALLKEATTPETPEGRLLVLAKGEVAEVARAASSRVMRLRIQEGLVALHQGAAPEAVAMALLVEALKAMPGIAAAYSSGELDVLFDEIGFVGDERDLFATALKAFLAALVAVRGPLVDEIARELAPAWGGSIAELLISSAAVPEKDATAAEESK